MTFANPEYLILLFLLMPYVVMVTVLAISLVIDKKRQNARKSSLTGASVK